MHIARRIGTLLGALVIARAAQAQSINFDNVTAPCLFNQATQLTTLYSSLGVTFGGAGGGAILNQCGNFGINARSGPNLLGFNTDTYATGPQDIFFASAMSSFSIFVAGPGGTYTARAFDFSGNQIGIQSVTLPFITWTNLSLNAPGTRRIQLSATGVPDWAVDDMSFQATVTIPEPGTYALLAIGLVLLAGMTRRRRT